MNMNVDQINELIKNHNPFAGQTIVKSHQIWENTFADVPTINNHASDAVFSALELINSGQRQSVVGITIVGDKGIGKTQVISRIRHHLQKENSGIFIYVSEYSGTNVKSVFLKRLSESMKKIGSLPKISQWQEIATLLINEASGKNLLPARYISYFTERPDFEKRIEEFNFEKRIQRILQVRSDINDLYLIKGILLTLIPKYSDYAVRWLAGQELTQAQLEAMDLPPVKDNAGEAFNQACELLKIISKYKTPVICFDELDSTDRDSSGLKLSHTVPSLGKDLSNSLERCILLFAMYPHTWQDDIKSLPRTEAVVDRIADYPQQGEPVALNRLNGDQILELVKTWLNNFYQKHNINPPDPLYPFTADQLKNWGRERLTVRQVLQECDKYWRSLTFSSEQSEHPVTDNITVTENTDNIIENNAVKENNLTKIAFTSELEEVNSKIDSLMNDNQVIIDALGFCFTHLVGKTIERFNIEKIEPLKINYCFKIFGTDHNTPITIGVAVSQYSNMQSLGAVLKQLVNYEKHKLTRGCLVRSKDTSPGARGVRQQLDVLLNEKGGEWVSFKEEHISQIIALRELYQNRADYDLTEEQIWQFASHEKIITENYLVKEILSAPPGKEPDNLTDEDADL